MSTHALVEEIESSSYIRGGMAIGDGPLAGSCEEGSSLRDGKLSVGILVFLLLFFFFFFICCCCCEGVEVSGSDRCIESGVSSLDGLVLLSRESLVIVDVLKSLIPILQRFSP